MNNSKDSTSWESVCSEGRVEFRAACNQIIDPSLRPIKKQVIRRIIDSSEARELFKDLWMRADSRSDVFLDMLSRSASWQTLVAEHMEVDHSWVSLLNWKSFGGHLWQWLKSLVQKLLDRHHPAARAATTVLIALGTLRGVQYVAPTLYGELSMPIRTSFSGQGITVPVTFTPTGNVPVVLNVSSDGTPVKLHFAEDNAGGSPDGLNRLIAELHDSNQSARQIASNLQVVAQHAPQLDTIARDKTLQGMFQLATNQVEIFHQNLNDFKKWYDSTLTTQGHNVSQQLGVLALASSSHAIPLILRQNSKQSVVLPSFDAVSGKSSVQVIELEIGKIISNSSGLSVNVRVTPQGQQASIQTVKEGQEFPIKSSDWKMIVNSIESHRLGKHLVQITLSLDAAGFTLPDNSCRTPSTVAKSTP
jgi:hypothetical protein